MSLPDPIPGLVVSYSCLWAREHGMGAEEGRKDRPCAVVAARQVIEGREAVTLRLCPTGRSATLAAHIVDGNRSADSEGDWASRSSPSIGR